MVVIQIAPSFSVYTARECVRVVRRRRYECEHVAVSRIHRHKSAHIVHRRWLGFAAFVEERRIRRRPSEDFLRDALQI